MVGAGWSRGDRCVPAVEIVVVCAIDQMGLKAAWVQFPIC